jgi:uroporphyrinogen-III synthase
MNADKPLDGLAILVTRPERQACRFCELVEAGGGKAVRFPTMEIRGLNPVGSPLADAKRLKRFDWMIFISANAVYFALKACNNALFVPPNLKVAAIGQATAAALEQSGMRVDLVPVARFNSEEFLTLPEMQAVAGQRFLIIRGQGGREVLAETLRQRGAAVAYLEVYRRLRPTVDIHDCLKRWRGTGIDAVTIFSGESLVNFIAMLGDEGMGWAREIPLVVAGERIAAQAEAAGFKKVILASNATDWALFEALAKVSGSVGV